MECNQCKKYKSLEQFRTINNNLNKNFKMHVYVCKECVNKNKQHYITSKLEEIAAYLEHTTEVINEVLALYTDVDNVKHC